MVATVTRRGNLLFFAQWYRRRRRLQPVVWMADSWLSEVDALGMLISTNCYTSWRGTIAHRPALSPLLSC